MQSFLFYFKVSPVIDTEPVSKTVTEGTMVKFFCNATGNPLPEITWIRNRETVGQGETISFETSRDQSGEYWCLVENGMSPNASASANLDVQCKWRLCIGKRTAVHLFHEYTNSSLP